MPNIILDRMQARIKTAVDDSSLFPDCILYGELVLKLVVLGAVATVGPNKERLDYAAEYKIVHADGLGGWREALDDVLAGPAAQYTLPEALEERRQLTQNVSQGTWQHEAASGLHSVLVDIGISDEAWSGKLSLRQWVQDFVVLRNKKAHGAQLTETLLRVADRLRGSIDIVAQNYSLFAREWAFLHQNQSGKYHVTSLSDSAGDFDYLKSSRGGSLADGVYVWYGRPILLDLIDSSQSAVDFFLPNGNYRDGDFETISYLNGSTMHNTERRYVIPASSLPPSETQGLGILKVRGKTFSNVPGTITGYVDRPSLEQELRTRLLNTSQFPIVTLLGAGGIGKTSTALRVLEAVADDGTFGVIVWLSARDIDLMLEGPKQVQPAVLTRDDVAKRFAEYMLSPAERAAKGFSATKYMEQEFAASGLGQPMLVVLDNFETVANPGDLYAWVINNVRLPNKVLITTRMRDFKADYPIEVQGMTWSECHELIRQTSIELGVDSLLDEDYAHDLWESTDGHPYVIKMLLGEMSKTHRRTSNLSQLVNRRSDVLTALFERTFMHLSRGAKMVFLTLAKCRSFVAEAIIDAVMSAFPIPAEGQLSVAAAIDELKGSSLVELKEASSDGSVFLSVPMTASIYGARKLETEPKESAVMLFVQKLRMFGSLQESDIRHGLEAPIKRFFSRLSIEIEQRRVNIGDYAECLDILAHSYPKVLLLRADLMDELRLPDDPTSREDLLKSYVQQVTSDAEKLEGWHRLRVLYERDKNAMAEMHALAKICNLATVSLGVISEAAATANQLFTHDYDAFSPDEKKLLSGSIADAMKTRMANANASDCSRLAWLMLRSGREPEAREWTTRGLEIEPENEHCIALAGRLHLLA